MCPERPISIPPVVLLRNRSGKIRESIPFFERAVELDPQFCSAYA